MQLEERIARLIAVGASVAANCQPCLEANIQKALTAGAENKQVAEAIAVGKLVREGAAAGVDSFISQLESPAIATRLDGISCDCAQPRRTA